jgi:hypothetical protein
MIKKLAKREQKIEGIEAFMIAISVSTALRFCRDRHGVRSFPEESKLEFGIGFGIFWSFGHIWHTRRIPPLASNLSTSKRDKIERNWTLTFDQNIEVLNLLFPLSGIEAHYCPEDQFDLELPFWCSLVVRIL